MNPATFPPPPPGPPPAHRPLRAPRGRARLLLLALLLLALGATWYITTRGGWVNALRLPPVLDASTPRSQNGWTLEDIQRPGPHQNGNGQPFAGFRYENVTSEYSLDPRVTDTADAFGLWLTPPPGSLTAGISGSNPSDPAHDPFVASARLSNGETLTLLWKVCTATDYVPPGETVHTFVFVTLPTGYPNSCRFVDFTLSDRSGHTAHWRVTRLPRMRHAIAPPVKVTDTVTKNGVTMSAHAWSWPFAPQGRRTQAILRPVLPAHSHQWDVAVLRQEMEWEAYDGDSSPSNLYPGTPVLGRQGVFDSAGELWYGGGVSAGSIELPYREDTHFLKLATELRQFETYDEPVTLHNVPVGHDDYSYCLVLTKPVSFTTPSGVTVTLPVQGAEVSKKKLPIEPDRLRVLVTTQPRITFDANAYSLPNSPLAHTYGKSVQLALQFAPPFHLSGSMEKGDGSPTDYDVFLPTGPKGSVKAPPLVLKEFTLIVHQRVDIQTIPMTFTVPIADHAPPTYPKDYKGPRF